VAVFARNQIKFAPSSAGKWAGLNSNREEDDDLCERRSSVTKLFQLTCVRTGDRPVLKWTVPMPFLVQAIVDDHRLAVAFEAAKEAFAKAVEWHVVRRFTDISINDGTKSYLIDEFASSMALLDIASTVETDAARGLQPDPCGRSPLTTATSKARKD
jgi:hypothetical protein